MSPIVGWRMHCVDCGSGGDTDNEDGVDFCEHCFRYRATMHDKHHTVTVITEPRVFGVPNSQEVAQPNLFTPLLSQSPISVTPSFTGTVGGGNSPAPNLFQSNTANPAWSTSGFSFTGPTFTTPSSSSANGSGFKWGAPVPYGQPINNNNNNNNEMYVDPGNAQRCDEKQLNFSF